MCPDRSLLHSGLGKIEEKSSMQKGAVQGQSEKNVFFALALHGPFLL
jgi:hypothetical protein